MDISYLLLLQGIREKLGPAVEVFMGIISAIDVHAMVILIPAILYWCLSKRDGQFVFFTFGFGEILNGILKLSVCCYRPWIRDARIIPSKYAVAGATGYSFPSGHSTNAGTIFVSTGWRLRNRYKHIVTIVFFVFSALVMFSRNYLTVHTPQDVIVGMSLAIFTIWTATLFMGWIEKNEKKDVIAVIVALVGVALSLLYFKFKSYPLDYVNGELLVDPQKMMNDSFSNAGRFAVIMVAWLLERRFIKFSTDCSVVEKIVRFVLGLVVLLLIIYLIVPAVTGIFGGHTGRFLKGFIELFAVTFIVPCLFIPLSKIFAKTKNS